MFCPYIRDLRLEYEDVLDIHGDITKNRFMVFK